MSDRSDGPGGRSGGVHADDDRAAGQGHRPDGADEVLRRWAEQTDASRAAIQGMTPKDARAAQLAHEERLRRLGTLAEEGAAPEDPRAQAVVAEMHRAMQAMWTPDAAAFTEVGEQLAAQPESAAVLSRVTPALPTFLREAYAHYAAAQLS